jgi:hypothetical protein
MEGVVQLFRNSGVTEKKTCRLHGRLTLTKRAAVLAAILPSVIALGQTRELPKQVTQPTAQKVVMEHLAAFNACDWKRLMAQFPENVEFFLPGGEVVRGRKAVGEMFSKIVKPPAQGGVCGIKVTVEHTFVVDGVFNIQWRADAPFLAEPYRGADAYETKDGLMAAQVTTFDAGAMKMKH